MPAERLGQPPPIVQSMILADHVHRDSMTNKKFILGTYNSVVTDKFPYPKSLCLYLAITNAHGPLLLRIRLIDVDDQQSPVYETAYPVDLHDPNNVYELTIGAAVVFPAPGDYRLQLYAGSELLRELRLRVVLAKQRVEPPEEL